VKRFDPRRVKIHRSYTVEEAANLLGVHKNTVRGWLKAGLPAVDRRRPILILGRHLSRFLHARRKEKSKRCRPGEFYCLRCRAPKTTVAHKAEYLPITGTSGNLRGTCSDCGARIYRRVSMEKLAIVAGDLQITVPQAQERIEETVCPSLNSDLGHEAHTYAQSQSRK
jgi:excisionase family DNA binding protein